MSVQRAHPDFQSFKANSPESEPEAQAQLQMPGGMRVWWEEPTSKQTTEGRAGFGVCQREAQTALLSIQKLAVIQVNKAMGIKAYLFYLCSVLHKWSVWAPLRLHKCNYLLPYIHSDLILMLCDLG
jgi:hypothetical protein